MNLSAVRVDKVCSPRSLSAIAAAAFGGILLFCSVLERPDDGSGWAILSRWALEIWYASIYVWNNTNERPADMNS